MKTTKKLLLTVAVGLLCSSPALFARPDAQQWDNGKVEKYLKKALEGEGYIEDHIHTLRHEAGHPNLAAFIEEFKEGYSNYPAGVLRLTYAVGLGAKHGITGGLLLKLKKILKKIKDEVWEAALNRSKNTVIMDAHTEGDIEYDDIDGRHVAHYEANVHIEDRLIGQ